MERLKDGAQLITLALMAPFVALAAWVVALLKRGRIIPGALSVDRHGIKTAVVTYVRPEDEKRVTLVGVMHVADREYFAELRERIDAEEADGTIVLFERTRDAATPLPDDDQSAAAVLERRLDGMKDGYRFIAALSDKAYQMDDLRPKESWINTDLTRREVARYLTRSWVIRIIVRLQTLIGQAVREVIRLKRRLDDRIGRQAPVKDDEPIKPYFPMMFITDLQTRAMPLSFLLFAPFRFISWRPHFAKVILLMRNMIGYHGIVDELRYSDDVLSIWGAAHLPGIGSLLEQTGFVLTSVEWQVCSRFRRYWLWDVVRWILTGRHR